MKVCDYKGNIIRYYDFFIPYLVFHHSSQRKKNNSKMPSVPTINLSCMENRPLHSKLLWMHPFWSFFCIRYGHGRFFRVIGGFHLSCARPAAFLESAWMLGTTVRAPWTWKWTYGKGLAIDNDWHLIHRVCRWEGWCNMGCCSFYDKMTAPTPLLQQIWPRKVLHCRQRSGCLSPKQIS